MKPASYSQVYIHLVFSPKGRRSLLTEKIEDKVYRFIGQTIVNRNHKPYLINGMPDHIHILLGLNPVQAISDLVHDIKRCSSLYINENQLLDCRFSWQEGYGVFSYGKSQVKMISNYILNQKEHHQKMNFRSEYVGFLNRYGIAFEVPYLLEFYD